MADAVAIDQARHDEDRHGGPERDGQQRGRLRDHDEAAQPPRVHAIDDARQDQAANERRQTRRADQHSGPRPSQQRLGQGHMMGDEADLDGEAQRKGHGGAPQEQASISGRGDRREVERRRCVLSWELAVARQAEIGRAAIAQDDADQRTEQRHRDDAGHDQSSPEAELADGEQQERHACNGADARPHDGERHRPALMALEPGRDRRGDARHRERRPPEAEQHEAGIELPRRAHLSDQRHARRHAGQAQQQHGARPEPVDAAAHDALDAGAHEEEHGDRRSDLGDRPAVRRRHGLEVHAGAEKSERPGHGGNDEAGSDDPPAMEQGAQLDLSRCGGTNSPGPLPCNFMFAAPYRREQRSCQRVGRAR